MSAIPGERVIWISGDATLGTVAGVNWLGKEFFVLDAPRLIRAVKRNPLEDVIISECELLATLLIALLWGNRAGVSRILIVCADNLNVFHWLQNWKAKSGTACRTLQALVDYLVDNQVEVIPRYVRSGHNFPCGHLSRADEDGIGNWGICNHMTRVSSPDDWGAFCEQWKPEIDLFSQLSLDIRHHLQEHNSELV